MPRLEAYPALSATCPAAVDIIVWSDVHRGKQIRLVLSQDYAIAMNCVDDEISCGILQGPEVQARPIRRLLKLYQSVIGPLSPIRRKAPYGLQEGGLDFDPHRSSGRLASKVVP
jgi:hypothetical protein